MLKKLIVLGFAAAFLAACSEDPKEATTSNASGASTPAMTQTTTAAPVNAIKAGSAEDFVINVGDRVYYDLDKFSLSPEAQDTLKKQAAWLQRYPAVNITVEGNCDERGTREYNLALGERRANSVKDYLSALGIARTRIQTISYGKEKPVAEGHNEEAWAQNRNAMTVPQIPGS